MLKASQKKKATREETEQIATAVQVKYAAFEAIEVKEEGDHWSYVYRNETKGPKQANKGGVAEMSKLPNPDQAVVPIEKFTGYVLNPEHPVGKNKARVFKSALGLTLDDASLLQDKVRQVATTHDAVEQGRNSYGRRFVIDFEMTTDVGTTTVRSAWIVRNGEDFPRLTSCYVK